VNFLLDQNLSPRLAELLTTADHSAQHVRDLHLIQASDQEVLAAAEQASAVLLSADTDFGELLARSNADRPSEILLRRQEGRRASEIAALIVANLAAITNDLDAGALVVIDDDRIRVRNLPFRPDH
jgi:predicted nuclease of predicted toxin-antitoxin system